MKAWHALIPLAALSLAAGGFFLWPEGGASLSPVAPIPGEAQEPPPPEVRRHMIVEDDTFTKAMEALGAGYAEALAILEAAADTYDFANIRLGKELALTLNDDGTPRLLTYEPNASDAIVVERGDDGTWSAREEEIEYDIEVVKARGTISSSLYEAGLEAGMGEGAIITLADTFAWSVDFATQVREGDSFEVAYEKRSRDGVEAGTGRVLTASFTNDGTRHEAYLFEMDGKDGYYDESGNSLVRQFLKAPLSYSRITSGYTMARFHPVLGNNQPHRAIDYAAPAGTPVMATADGIISSYGWNGGYGNMASVRHNSTFTTNYAHLSKFAKGLKRGSAVKQGQVIGHVGSTGLSTGPHLHYEIVKDGTKVNPLQVELPAGDPIPEEQRAAFEERREELRKLLKN